jgi:hypothetical protein
MDKELLSQINSTRKEIEELREKIDKINNKPAKIVIDSVKGSSASYPYISHNCVIEGLDNKKTIANKKSRNKYKKQIKNKEFKLMKLITNLEYELNNVEDSEIRRIIRHKYEENLNWIQIMFKMNYNSESKARMKLERFLKDLQP